MSPEPRPDDRGSEPDAARARPVWETLAGWRAERRRFVLATVVDSRGFTPRKPGAHMLIAADGTLAGTIGGGAIEREVIEQAIGLLATGATSVVKKHLTQELGMCCGGEMSVFLEVVAPAPRLWVYGAGYIAKPLAALAATCGFDVTVVDARPEWAAAERFPAATVRCREPEEVLREEPPGPDDYAVVVTHDHALDQRLVQALLRHPLAFLGMIGSVPKQRKFALRLRARGFTDAEIARLHTPLGVSIGADTPEEIAVSVMAELIAVRRGLAQSPGWTPPARPGPASESRAQTSGSSETAKSSRSHSTERTEAE